MCMLPGKQIVAGSNLKADIFAPDISLHHISQTFHCIMQRFLKAVKMLIYFIKMGCKGV